MTYKTLILATFVKKPLLSDKLNELTKKFNIKKEDFYIFEDSTNPQRNILTYKISLSVDEHFEIKTLPDSVILHKKEGVFYTINGLNLLIESEFGLQKGNINHKKYKVEWSKYKDKFILSNGDVLNIIPVVKVG